MIKDAAQPGMFVGWMDSLADPVRLRVLRLLERRELGVVELCNVLQLPQSTVSRHLKLLSDQRWVDNRREGTANLYRMTLDELEPAARRLWLLTREQTTDWPALEQDRLRLQRVLSARQDDPQAFFAGAASQWESMRGSLYGHGFNTAALLALLPSEWTVADLGCGTGTLAATLAPHVKSVIGVDQSAAMLRAAKKRTEMFANVELKKGDLEAIPIDDSSCDAALIVLVLTYVSQPAVVLREAARVLVPGGKLIIVDLLRHDRDDFRRQVGQQSLGFEREQMERMMATAGLTLTQWSSLAPEPEAKGPALVVVTAVKPTDKGDKSR